MTYSLTGKRIFLAGHRDMVGSVLVRRLGSESCEILTAGRDLTDLTNLTDSATIHGWMRAERHDVVIVAAARVGGIHANNTRPAEFLYENLVIEAYLIHAAHRAEVEKLLFLGSTCIYPKTAPQPLKEEYPLTGLLEPTNEWYAIAKIGGIKLCQAYRRQHGRDFISAQPTNLYGPGRQLRSGKQPRAAGAPAQVPRGSGNRRFLGFALGGRDDRCAESA